MTMPSVMPAQTGHDTGSPRVVVRDDVAPDAIDRYVHATPEATGYHLTSWMRVIERAFGHRTRYLVAESDGAIAGLLPLVFFESRIFGRFVVSMPFLNYGGVVAATTPP